MRGPVMVAVTVLAALAAAGCSKSGTVFGGGELDRSVQYIGVSREVEVVNVPKLVRKGGATCFDVVLRNNDKQRKQWELECRFQFFDAQGRELQEATGGWQQLTIGRGETKTVSGCCLVEGAERATCIIRKWNRWN